MTLAQDNKGLSIYWDYDAAHLNLEAVSGYEVVKKIRSAVQSFGFIQSFKMYHDPTNHSLSNLRSEVCSSGVTIIDCPSNGRKEAATKMMIVDIIAYTWDHPAPRTIVIISGDRDLAYMIGTLRMRKYEVILISPNGTHTSLTNQASENFDWIDGHERDMDDARGGQLSPHTPSPHLPSPSHQFLSPFPSPPLPAANGFFSHYTKTNFLSKAQEFDPPVVELRGMPTARGRQKPAFSHSDRFNIFGDFGDSFPSPSISNSLFGLGDGRSQHPARQVRSDSAPPDMYSTHSPVSPLDSNGFGRIPSSAKGKQRKFSIELEDIAPQSPTSKSPTAKFPEEPPMAEELFASTDPFAKMKDPLSVPTSPESVNIDTDNTTERGKTSTTITTPLREEEAISTKKSPRADLPIQPQAPDPSPTPLPPSQKAPSSKLNAQAGTSSKPSKKEVAPHFQVLVDTLRKHGGSCMKSSLPSLLLSRDQAVYKKAQVSKYSRYIASAVEARLVREVTSTKGLYIFLEEYP